MTHLSPLPPLLALLSMPPSFFLWTASSLSLIVLLALFAHVGTWFKLICRNLSKLLQIAFLTVVTTVISLAATLMMHLFLTPLAVGGYSGTGSPDPPMALLTLAPAPSSTRPPPLILLLILLGPTSSLFSTQLFAFSGPSFSLNRPLIRPAELHPFAK
jgi:hypothetical protein